MKIKNNTYILPRYELCNGKLEVIEDTGAKSDPFQTQHITFVKEGQIGCDPQQVIIALINHYQSEGKMDVVKHLQKAVVWGKRK
jgi:hypothetical protein